MAHGEDHGEADLELKKKRTARSIMREASQQVCSREWAAAAGTFETLRRSLQKPVGGGRHELPTPMCGGLPASPIALRKTVKQPSSHLQVAHARGTTRPAAY